MDRIFFLNSSKYYKLYTKLFTLKLSVRLLIKMKSHFFFEIVEKTQTVGLSGANNILFWQLKNKYLFMLWCWNERT